MSKTHLRRFKRTKQYYPEVAAQLKSYGIHSVPISPGTKRPATLNWPDPMSDEKFHNACAQYTNYGTGVLLGEVNGLIAVDLDLDKNDPFQNILYERIKSEIPESSIERFGSKGFGRFFKYLSEKSFSRSYEIYNFIERRIIDSFKPFELLSDRKQILIPPTDHPSGKKYIFIKGSLESFADKDKLPILPPNLTEKIDKVILNFKAECDLRLKEDVAAGKFVLESTEKSEPSVGRNDKLKSMAVAAIKKETPIEEIVKQLVKYDRKYHAPPLFNDKSHGYIGEPEASAKKFIDSISSSIKPKSDIPLFISLGELMTSDKIKDIDFLVEDLLPIPGTSLIAGQPKLGKTTLVLDIMKKLILGEMIFGRITKTTNVLFITLENKVEHYKKVLKDWHSDKLSDRIFFSTKPVTENNTDDILQLIQYKDVGLVVIDTMTKFLKCSDVNDYGKMVTELNKLSDLAEKAKVHILTTHHTSKSQDNRGTGSILGSTAITGGVDTVFLYEGRKSQTTRLLSSENRYGRSIKIQIDFDPVTSSFTLLEGDEKIDHRSIAKRSILKRISDSERPLKKEELVRGHRKELAIEVINELLAEGLIISSGSGKKFDPRIYRVPLEAH